MSNNTSIATVEQETAAFELVQRKAKMLASSSLVPKEFQGNTANCAIGLNIASRLGADAFMVIQNLDVIHGRPSFRGKFLIAMVNASGRFSPLKFRFDGEGDSYGCTAYATDKESGEIIEGPKVDWNMVKGEGWLSKSGSKWKTMAELMFRYRSGAYFANIYAPDITLGMMTSEEVEDIPSIRTASGRVVNEEAPTISGYEELPPIKPEDGLEEPHEAPVEVSEATEREGLLNDIMETLHDMAKTPAYFIGRARNLGEIPSGVNLTNATIEQLRTLHANRKVIAQS